ncbi:lysis protein [Pantoea dispersa]|uniref:lysis protein n=1 Tax=Pantoea dispersa TaxID=59814 RepID=UPI003015BEA0
MTRVLLIIIAVFVLLLAGIGLLASHYRGNAIDYKSQRDKATGDLKLANATIDDMTVRQRAVAALDEKYTKELASAQATIDQLQRDVASGKRRLQLNATCTKQSATPTGGMGDDATVRLTADAERDYWRLRNGISNITSQVNYLQQYIKEQCR